MSSILQRPKYVYALGLLIWVRVEFDRYPTVFMRQSDNTILNTQMQNCPKIVFSESDMIRGVCRDLQYNHPSIEDYTRIPRVILWSRNEAHQGNHRRCAQK